MERCRDRYGDTFTLRIQNEGTWVMLSDPAAVKQVFTGDPKLLHAGEANGILRPILGPNSVLLLDDARAPGPAQAAAAAVPRRADEGLRRADGAVAEDEIARWPAGEVVPTRQAMQRITLEIVMRAVFGVSDASGLGRMRAALATMLDWTTRPSRLAMVAVAGPKGMHRLPEYRQVMGELDAVIAEEIAAPPRRRGRRRARRCALDAAAGDRHEDDGRRWATPSCATSSSRCSSPATRRPRPRCRGRSSGSRATRSAWARLRAGDEPYLDAVIKETLRLRPVLPIVLRRLKAPMEIGGYALPAGVSAVPCIYLVHRRADVYPDPLAFRPERFLERPAGTYTWIPFGGGIRRCLGASFAQFEMAAVLRVLARRCARLEPDALVPERVARRSITLVPAREGACSSVGAPLNVQRRLGGW